MRPHVFALAALLLPVSLHAQITQRDTLTGVTPGAAPDFSGAQFVYANSLAVPNFTGSTSFTLNVAAGAQNIVFAGYNGVTVSPTSAPDGTSSVVYTVTGTGTPNGSYGFSYNGGATGFLTPTIIGGRYALAFNGGGSNGPQTGATFNTTVSIFGNWADPASRTTATYNTGWDLVENFVYNPLTTTTRFTISNTNFQGNNPTISFALLGGEVGAAPEPGTWAMMIVGFGAAGVALRRARRKAFTNVLRQQA